MPRSRWRSLNQNSLFVLRLLEVAGLGPQSYTKTKKNLEELLSENGEDDFGDQTFSSDEQTLDTRSRIFFDAVANTMSHMYKMDLQYLDCFRGALHKKELEGSVEVYYLLRSESGA